MRDFIRPGNAEGRQALMKSELLRRRRFVRRWMLKVGGSAWVLSSILLILNAKPHWRRSLAAYLEYGFLAILAGALSTCLIAWVAARVLWKVLDKPSLDDE